MTTQPETPVVERVSRLEGAYEQVTERLNDLTQAVTNVHNEVHEVETRLSEKIDVETKALNAKIDAQNEKIDRLRSEMHRQTVLVVGLLGGLMALLRFVG